MTDVLWGPDGHWGEGPRCYASIKRVSKKAHCRIDGIVAREAPVAVIFRRGPSQYCQLLTWNLETDEITPGQWIHGKVFTRRCDLSPNGAYLISGISDYSRNRRSAVEQYGLKYEHMASGWTAISKPPFFTALALWFSGDSWNGGGLFESDRLVKVNSNPHWHTAIKPSGPVKAKDLKLGGSEDEPLFTLLLESRGWITQSPYHVRMKNKEQWFKSQMKLLAADVFSMLREREGKLDWLQALLQLPEFEMLSAGCKTKRFDSGQLRFEEWMEPGKGLDGMKERWSVIDANGTTVKAWEPRSHHPQFLDVDHNGRILFGEMGCLYAWENFPKAKPTLIADLNDNVFEPIAPTEWAKSW